MEHNNEGTGDKEFDNLIEIASRIRGIEYQTIEQQRATLAMTLGCLGMSLPEYVGIHNRNGDFDKK